MAIIYYTKRFTSGNLRGLSVNLHVSFDDKRTQQMAKRFRRGAIGSDAITGDKYVITDASFQNYVRDYTRREV